MRVRVAGVMGGEVESWEQTLADLASEHGAALKRHAFLLCGDEAQADDLVQEALVRAFTRRLSGAESGEALVSIQRRSAAGPENRRAWPVAGPQPRRRAGPERAPPLGTAARPAGRNPRPSA
jgi:hypothetical protein